MRNRIFVVNEPLQRAPNGDGWMRKINLEPAREHGELVFLLPAGQLPSDPAPTVDALKRGLAGLCRNDALLLVGDMRAIAWAVAIASSHTGGLLRLLVWDGARRRYELTETNVFVPKLHALAAMEDLLNGGNDAQ